MFIPQMQCGIEPPYYETLQGVGKVESTAHWSWYMCELKNQANAPKTTANPYQQRTSDLSGMPVPPPAAPKSWWEVLPHDMQLLLVGGTIVLIITILVLVVQSKRSHNA